MMHMFNYDAPAELYPSRRYAKSSQGLYRRFETATEAIRHLMEDLPAVAVAGSFLEVEEHRYDGAAIRRLYESASYPLQRRAKAA
jgi:hypothetical protein